MQVIERATDRDRPAHADPHDPEQRFAKQRRFVRLGVFRALACLGAALIFLLFAHCGSCRSAGSVSRMASMFAATRAFSAAISSGSKSSGCSNLRHEARAARSTMI